MRLLSRITTVMTAMIIAVFSVNILAVMDVQAAQNNGTLKVHEKGTLSGTESNDPKVCAFNLEGFSFNNNQSGYVVIATQPGAVNTLTVPFGPINGLGYAATAYINDGGVTLADGQYKATLYGKSTANPNLPNFNDEKAKSKVFKVQCPATPTVAVQPGTCIQRGAFNGTVSGTVYNTNDSTNATVLYTITAKHQTSPLVTRTDIRLIADGSSATFNFNLLTAGTYDLTVTGSDGTATAPTTFVVSVCNTPVTPTAPTKVDICGVINDTYTIPAKAGVTYYVNGNATPAGTYSGTGTTVITAVADTGYVISGTAVWTFNFDNTPCIVNVTATAPTKVEQCGTANDTYTIPAKTGVIYKVNGTTTPAGIYNATGSVAITAVADAGYAVTGTKSWNFTFSSVPCDIIVTPAAPTKSDVCARNNDTFTIPTTTGVTYFVNGWPVPAGTYKAYLPALIVAVAHPGYDIDSNAQQFWLFTYTNVKCAQPCHQLATMKFIGNQHWDGQEPCVPVSVAPAAPSSADLCGTANDTYTIPTSTGVIYKVNGTITPAGTYPATVPVTITAEATTGYVLGQGTASWTYDFTDTTCPAPVLTVVAECSPTGVVVTIKNDGDGDGIVYVNGTLVKVFAKTTVETTVSFSALFKADVLVADQTRTVLLDQAFDCTPGQGGAGSTTVITPTIKTTMPTELPTTGTGTVSQLIIMVILAVTTYGAMYFLQGRLDLQSRK